MLVEMRRVDIVAPRAREQVLLRALHRAGLVHFVPFGRPPGLSDATFRRATPTAAAGLVDQASERVAELRRLVGDGEPRASLVAELWELEGEALLERVRGLEPLHAEAADLAAERVRMVGEQIRTERYRLLIDGLQGIVEGLPSLRGYAATAIVLQARYRSLIGPMREELEKLTGGRCELIAADLAGDRVGAAIVYPERLTDEVRALLGGRDLEEVPLPADFAGLPFREIDRRLVASLETIRQRMTTVDGTLAGLRRAHGDELAALDVVLRDRAAESRVLSDSGVSDHLVLVCGWVPAGRLDDLRRALAREVGPGTLVVERPLDAARAAETPVAFENRAPLRSFEPLASFVTIPRYGSIDPTPFLAITLPVFIGLMVGDIGYGLVLLALLVLARGRWPRSGLLSRVLPIALLAAGSTIVFGLLFGELFGDLGTRLLGLRPIWFDRGEAAIAFLALAVAIGAAQVALGVILGIANAVLLRDRPAVASRTAMLVGLVAVGVLLGWIAGSLPASYGYFAAAALAVALAVLIATLGLAGPIELVGAVSNVLSYARLMAIGLASVMLAIVANELGGLPDNVLVGAIVAVLLHGLNIVLGFFDSSIQGLRLHYVEFFSKFVEPGGIRFEPFTSALAAAEAGLQPT